MNRCEGAVDVERTVEPAVNNFEDNENASRLEDAESFGECLILKFSRFEMVQDKSSEGGRKGLRCEGQPRGVTATDRP